MKILVAVKQVAALDEDFEILDDGRDVNPDYFIRDLNAGGMKTACKGSASQPIESQEIS